MLAETEALFDYQLRQIALSLRDQGAIDPPQAEVLADSELEVVIQVWTIDGRAVWASRTPVALPVTDNASEVANHGAAVGRQRSCRFP